MVKLPIVKKSAYLIKDRLIRKYLTGIDIAEGYLVVDEEMAFFTDMRYYSAVEGALKGLGIKPQVLNGLDDIYTYLKSKKVKRLFIDFERTTVSEFIEYSEMNFKLYDCAKTLNDFRQIKSDKEIESIKRACEITQKAVNFGIDNIKQGITEKQLATLIEDKMIELGADGTSFESIVAFSCNSAVPHHQTSDKVLEKGMVVLIDMGARKDGYSADITRTVYFGEPDKKFIDCYQAVLTANQTAIESIRVNDSLKDCDAYARNVLKEHGLAEYFTHSLGHGVGLEIHEEPRLSKKANGVIKNGMAFTIEPGVYFDGEFGIRIEDTVILKDDKVLRLFDDDKALKIIR